MEVNRKLYEITIINLIDLHLFMRAINFE